MPKATPAELTSKEDPTESPALKNTASRNCSLSTISIEPTMFTENNSTAELNPNDYETLAKYLQVSLFFSMIMAHLFFQNLAYQTKQQGTLLPGNFVTILPVTVSAPTTSVIHRASSPMPTEGITRHFLEKTTTNKNSSSFTLPTWIGHVEKISKKSSIDLPGEKKVEFKIHPRFSAKVLIQPENYQNSTQRPIPTMVLTTPRDSRKSVSPVSATAVVRAISTGVQEAAIEVVDSRDMGESRNKSEWIIGIFRYKL